MTREEQIKAIYEKIADKTLSFGCRIDYDYLGDGIKQKGKLICIDENSKRTNYRIFFDKFNGRDLDSITHKGLFDIIGHTVMIGDILDYIDTNLFRNPSKYEGVFEIDIQAREKCVITLYNHFIGRYRSPVEKLDDNGISFIYNLIKDE